MTESPTGMRNELGEPGKNLVLLYANQFGDFKTFEEIPVSVLGALLNDQIFASAAAATGGGERHFKGALGRRIADLTEASKHALRMAGDLDADDRQTQFELVGEAFSGKKPTLEPEEDFPF